MAERAPHRVEGFNVPQPNTPTQQPNTPTQQPNLSVNVNAAATPEDSSLQESINVLCSELDSATLLADDVDFMNAYEIGQQLGRGGWATVFAAMPRLWSVSKALPWLAAPAASSFPPDDTGPPPPLAVKVISKANLSQKMIDMHRTSISDVRRLVKRLRAECRVLAELTHPRMIQLVELCESPQNLFIVSERAFGGALLDRIVQAHEANGFNEDDARHVMRQLVDVLRFMHSHGVIHRDIKPENILLQSADEHTWDIKVSDFGFAKIFSDQESLARSLPPGGPNWRCTSFVGTKNYRAPEQIYNYPPYPTTYGTPVDVWSAGVVMHVLLAGRFPFRSEALVPAPPTERPGGGGAIDTAAAAAAGPSLLCEDELDFEELADVVTPAQPSYLPENVSENAKSAIKAMLVADPRQRATAAQMLEHPWLKEAEPPTLSEAEVRQAFDDIGVGGSLTLDETYMEGIRSLVASGLAKRARELMTSGVFETGSRMGSLCSDATGGGSRSGSFRMQSFGPRKKGARLGSAPMAADNSVLAAAGAASSTPQTAAIGTPLVEGSSQIAPQITPLVPGPERAGVQEVEPRQRSERARFESTANMDAEAWRELREALAAARELSPARIS